MSVNMVKIITKLKIRSVTHYRGVQREENVKRVDNTTQYYVCTLYIVHVGT